MPPKPSRPQGRTHGHAIAARPHEPHRLLRIGWLRAAVLGANDGIVSTASVVLGVASAHAPHGSVVAAAIASLVGGAMSMATGEFVSVSSQADTERAALAQERAELRADSGAELRELAGIYRHRGLDAELAHRVAEQLTAHDALGAHARDELGISDLARATSRPLQAALASAASFGAGAALPLLVAVLVAGPRLPLAVACSALLALGVLGGVAARAGGAGLLRGVVRVTFWSALAMAVTAAAGAWFGAA